MIVVRAADGFNHVTAAPVRILPRGNYVDVLQFDRGTWDLLYTTPFAVEIEVREQ